MCELMRPTERPIPLENNNTAARKKEKKSASVANFQ